MKKKRDGFAINWRSCMWPLYIMEILFLVSEIKTKVGVGLRGNEREGVEWSGAIEVGPTFG